MFNFIRTAMIKASLKFHEFASEESGEVNIVAIVVLIAIAVMLALFFREQITGILKTLFQGITDNIGTTLDPVS